MQQEKITEELLVVVLRGSMKLGTAHVYGDTSKSAIAA